MVLLVPSGSVSCCQSISELSEVARLEGEYWLSPFEAVCGAHMSVSEASGVDEGSDDVAVARYRG